jgi:hypothetical protein
MGGSKAHHFPNEGYEQGLENLRGMPDLGDSQDHIKQPSRSVGTAQCDCEDAPSIP